MAVHRKVAALWAGDATVIREDVDKLSTMAHDVLTDLVVQRERVVSGRPVALRDHRRLRAIRHQYCDNWHSGISSQPCDLGQLGIEGLQLHLPFGIRFRYQKVGVNLVSKIRPNVLILTLARD